MNSRLISGRVVRTRVPRRVPRRAREKSERAPRSRAFFRIDEGIVGRWAMGAAIAALVSVSNGLIPTTATADIDVQHIEFFKGLDRFSGQVPPNSGYFVELCLVAIDVTSAQVTPPGQPACPMDDFVIDRSGVLLRARVRHAARTRHRLSHGTGPELHGRHRRGRRAGQRSGRIQRG